MDRPKRLLPNAGCDPRARPRERAAHHRQRVDRSRRQRLHDVAIERHGAFNTGWLSVTGQKGFKPSQVYYVVGTYDAQTGASLYVDGEIVANEMPGGGAPESATGRQQHDLYRRLNSSQFGMTDYFQGDISDCAVYDHALTPVQVADHYNVGARKHVIPHPLPTPKPTPRHRPPRRCRVRSCTTPTRPASMVPST